MNKKLKVVWLCHLSNNEIQSILHPWRRVPEFAPWIFNCINVIEENPQFELHIVAPFYYIGRTHEFELRGIKYHFYNPFFPIIGHHLFSVNGKNFFEHTDFSKSKKIVSYIIKSINPDIIHLYGAENPYYSAAILPLVNSFPTILTIQGFISHTKSIITPSIAKSIEVEKRVIKSVPFCFYRSEAQKKYILDINPQMKLIHHFFCSYELKYNQLPSNKKFDIVFFAAITKDKGIVDLLKALQLIKQRKPKVSLCVIGGGNYEQYVKLSKVLGVFDNIIWTGFLPSRRDVHFLAAQCRVSVLPTYNDMYPGTIIESMFLEIPMITYDIDSNHEINQEYEAIRLVKVGDINSLAQNIYQLLVDDEQRNCLAAAGKKRAYEMFAPSNQTMICDWLTGYKQSINSFKNH